MVNFSWDIHKDLKFYQELISLNLLPKMAEINVLAKGKFQLIQYMEIAQTQFLILLILYVFLMTMT